MWLTLILTSILPDEMASGSDSESLYLVERMGRSNIGPIFGHVVIYYFYVYVKGLAAEWFFDCNVSCMVSLMLTSRFLMLVLIFLRQMGQMKKAALKLTKPPKLSACGA